MTADDLFREAAKMDECGLMSENARALLRLLIGGLRVDCKKATADIADFIRETGCSFADAHRLGIKAAQELEALCIAFWPRMDSTGMVIIADMCEAIGSLARRKK